MTTGLTRATATPWIGYRQPVQYPRLRLFCFPFAGGGAAYVMEMSDAQVEEMLVPSSGVKG